MIRVGLVGFGMAGRVFHAPLISSVEGLELAAVVERNSNKAAERYSGITTFRTLKDLLQDASIKLVVVATPNKTHSEIALEALLAGKNVVVDKPMALRSDDIAPLMELAAGVGLYLIPFHNRLWDSDFQTIHKLLHDETLGHLLDFESNFDRWRPGQSTRPWKEDPDEGGILLDIGTHLVDQALALFGDPETVSAEVRREREGEGPNDSFTIRLCFYGGIKATLSANVLSSLPRPRFYLRGTKGNYRKWGTDPQEEALNRVTRIDDPHWGEEPAANWGKLCMEVNGALKTEPVTPIPGDYRLFYTGVRDALLGISHAPVAAVAAWRTARVLEWAAESSEQHCEVACHWTGMPE